MRWSGVRPSRALLMVLGLVLVAGVWITVNKLSSQRGERASRAQSPAPEPPPLLMAGTQPPADLGKAPATAPTTGPSLLAAAAVVTLPPGSAPPPVLFDSLADARAKFEKGDLVAARAMLTRLLVAGSLDDAKAKGARDLLHDISALLLFSARRFPDDPFSAAYTVQGGEVVTRIAPKFDITGAMLCRVNGLSDPRRLQVGQKLKVIKGPFHALVSKSKFVMDLYLGEPGEKGSVIAMSFPVGIGKEDSTPVGSWLVESGKKLIKPVYYPSETARARGEVVRQSGDPKNPLGSRWIGLSGVSGDAVGKTSYGIHGTNAPTSIGKEESLGCVRMHNDDVELVYDMLIEGKSKVIVRP